MALYRIIALGDSLTYGYPFGQALSWVTKTGEALGTAILNRGVNGDNLRHFTKRLTHDVLDVHPEFCVVLGGTNDILQEVPLEQMKANFTELVEKLLEHKVLPVIGLPPPIQNPKMEKILTTFRNWLKRQAKAMSLKTIDFYKPFLDKRKRILPNVLEDGVHPTSHGYQLMSQAAAKVLGDLLQS